MGIWVSSKTTARRHGVYAIQRTPPATVRATGTSVVAIVAEFPWGPRQVLTTPAGTKELIQMFAPQGMSHLGQGYLALLAKGFPALRIVRAMAASGTAKASTILTTAGATTVATVTAKYEGTAGNSLVATVSTASDGDANHFDLAVTITGTSGTTTDLFKNLNGSAFGTKTDTTTMMADKLLVGAIAWGTSGRPTDGTYTFTTGADGSIAASDYVGTAGSGDAGLALLETDTSVRHVFVGDPGDALRAAVMAGLKAHADLMGDRVAYIHGDSGLAKAAVVSDVANYRSENCVYCAPWGYIYDDTTGAEQLVPTSGFAASVASQLSPSTSIAWKSGEVGAMLGGLVRLETDYGQGIPDLTDAGVACFIREEDGSHRIEAGVTTIAPSDPAKRNLTRTRMGQYIAVSFQSSVRPMCDAPNVTINQVSLVGALQDFMDTLVANKDRDPNHTPFVDGYNIGDLAAENSAAEIAAGDFSIPLNVRIGSAMERIFLSIQHGESVVVKAQ